MVVTIHQPEHLPWLGFFAKVALADVLVLLDQVQYRKNYFQNRNRVRTAGGATWLTVPVSTPSLQTPICAVSIANDSSPRWGRTHWRTLEQAYGSAPFFRHHSDFFRDVYTRRWERLSELNEHLIRYLLSELQVNVKVVRATDLAISSTDPTGRLIESCQRMQAAQYLSGTSGPAYLDVEAFRDAGIDLRVQHFQHPVYTQRYEPFMPCMSAIDLLFNHGPESARIVRGIDVETIDTVFD